MAAFSHIVIHGFDANGRTLVVGDRVDATNWKNISSLVSCKYLRPATPADKELPPQKVGASPVRKPLKRFVIKRK